MNPQVQISPEEARKREEEGQKALADRFKDRTWHPSVPRAEDAAVAIDSKLTTKEHLGKHPDEPDKEDEIERNKGGDLAKREFKIETIDQTAGEDGEVVDNIVVSPAGAAPVGHPDLHRNDAIGTARLIAEAQGDDGDGDGERKSRRKSKKEKKEEEAAAE